MKVMPAGKTDPGRQFSGTPTFSSIATFNGEQPGAHDDIEAMVCVFASKVSMRLCAVVNKLG